MRFWVFTGKAAAGPYDLDGLKRLPGFGPGTVVAPEGATSETSWKAARDFPGLRPLFAKAPLHPAPAARSAAGRAPKPHPVRPHPAPRQERSSPPASAHPRARAGGLLSWKGLRPAAALFQGRRLWVLAGFAVLVLLGAGLYSVFERLGSENARPAATPGTADPKRPMPFEAPGSPLLRK